LPDSNYSIQATLNIQPSQLTACARLVIDQAPVINTQVSQQVIDSKLDWLLNAFQIFNEAVLTNKVSVVRAALRNKSNGLDLDFVDEKGKTLLHRVSRKGVTSYLYF
jgi:hypothetical protein